MWKARKKQDKKEIPQWKLDLMRAESEATGGASSSSRAAPEEVPDPKPDPEPPSDKSYAAPPSTSASLKRPAEDIPKELDDDDDDDDFDPSKYDLGDTSDREEEQHLPSGVSGASAFCVVAVTGIAHQTTGDHLKTYFETCGPVVKVLRSVDVRERSAFVTFETEAAAQRALAKSGEMLHERPLGITLAMGSDGGGDSRTLALGKTRDEQLATLGIDTTRHPGRDAIGCERQRGVVYTADHEIGRVKVKQGREPSNMAMPVAAPFGFPGAAGRRPLPPGIDLSVGDWECPKCGNFNWQRRHACNKCSTPKGGR